MTTTVPTIPVADKTRKSAPEYFWLWVMCLLGLDYFSTLAYQPSITFEVAGPLGPIATALVVVATLFGALPIYCYLAKRSPGGAGSMGLLEELVRGWRGKTLILLLLGFAATDFVVLKSLSLSDAAVHILKNPHPGWQQWLPDAAAWLRDKAEAYGVDPKYCTEQLIATLLLSVLGFVFWFILRRGFNRNVMILAVPLVTVYLVLNGMLLYGGLRYALDHPELIQNWIDRVTSGEWGHVKPMHASYGWWGLLGVSLLFLPNLALGLSGFEMSMILMPQVKGKAGQQPPSRRIFNTRLVLITAALIMSVYLLGSTLLTCLFIPESAIHDGPASNRALAYIAHGQPLSVHVEKLLPFLGPEFGSFYDLVTIMILCLAGTSVITALASLLPQILLRFGMDFRWSQRWGLLLISFAGINFLVTIWFRASVEAQRGAYATGVLVMIASAALVSFLDQRRAQRIEGGFWHGVGVVYFMILAVGFLGIVLAVLVNSASGLWISACFIIAILALSVVSRAFRADELRTIGFEFKDDNSKLLWDSLRLADFPVLVPHRPGRHERTVKEKQIRREHQLSPEVDVVVVEAEVDDPSNFFQRLLIEVVQEDKLFVIKVHNCVSVAHALAAIALEMSRYSSPPGLHFGWPELDLLSASWSYFAFGEGNIPWKVRELITRSEPDPSKRPRVIVG